MPGSIFARLRVPLLGIGAGSVPKYPLPFLESSYDYNLTAQLITDGIICTEEPATLRVSTQNGELKKNEREWLLDGKPDSQYIIEGNTYVYCV